MQNNAISSELSRVYDWKDLNVSNELTAVGKELDEAVKLSGAVELREKMVNMRKQLYHALSMEKQGPSEEGLTAADKAEERVHNREAIASSTADARGITGAEKEKLIAEAMAKERAKVMESVKKQEEELQRKLEEAKAQSELAERHKQEAEQRQQIATAEAERERAEMEAELQRTRSRAKAEEDSKSKLEAILTNVRRKRDNEEHIDDADLAEAPAPKKRKTAEEAAEERLQKLIEKAGDEDEGRRLHKVHEQKRITDKKQRADDKEQALREKLCSSLEHDRKQLADRLEKSDTVRKAQDEELKKLRSDIKKSSSQSDRKELIKKLEKSDALCEAKEREIRQLTQQKHAERKEIAEDVAEVLKAYKMIVKAMKVRTGMPDAEYKALKSSILQKCGLVD
jgi:hypothetical protein